MKKLILAISLALASMGAAAQTGFVTTDYVKYASNSYGFENRIGFKTPSNEFGAFDLAFIYNTSRIENIGLSNQGAEVGFNSISHKLDNISLSGRIGTGGVSSEYYYSLQGEAKYALDSWVQPVVQYRFRDGFSSDWAGENRFLLGADFVLAKNIGLRFAYTYTAISGPNANGLTGTLSYGF